MRESAASLIRKFRLKWRHTSARTGPRSRISTPLKLETARSLEYDDPVVWVQVFS